MDGATRGPDPVTVVRLCEVAPGADPVRAVINVAARVDLALADRLHDPAAPRPYAAARGGPALDVVCFADDLARALLAGSPGAVIAARRRPAEIAAGFVGRTARVAFLSPTRFRVAGLDYLLPDPFHLFGGLLERWRALGWPEQPAPNVRRVAADVERLAVAEHGEGPRRRGFVGVVAYDLLGLEPAAQAAAWALLRFGEWRGAGAHTSYGCGRLRLLRPGADPARVGPAWAEGGAVTGRRGGPQRRWTAEEEMVVIRDIDRLTIPTLARRLGRTEQSVRSWCARRGVFPTTAGRLTSGWASEVSGYTPQHLTALARAGKIRARRAPGGRWWLFRAEDLPRRR